MIHLADRPTDFSAMMSSRKDIELVKKEVHSEKTDSLSGEQRTSRNPLLTPMNAASPQQLADSNSKEESIDQAHQKSE